MEVSHTLDLIKHHQYMIKYYEERLKWHNECLQNQFNNLNELSKQLEV